MKVQIKFLILTIGLFFCFNTDLSAQKKSHKRSKTEMAKYRIAILYPNAEGKTFDMKYYVEKHMTMMADILGKNLKALHIDKGLANGAVPGDPVPFLAIGYFYVASIEEYNKAIVPQLDRIRADFQNYTNILPMAQISEIVK